MRKFVLLFVLVFSFNNLLATDYYINQSSGSDTKNGKSVSNAFKTFDAARAVVSGGDTIFIIGEYHNPSYNPNYSFSAVNDPQLWNAENSIKIQDLKGSAGKYITIKPYNSDTILKGDGANIIRVQNCQYLIIEGFTIKGEASRIPLSTSLALQFTYLINDKSLKGKATAPNINDIIYRNKEETNDNDNIVEESDRYPDISKKNVVRPSYIDTRGLYVSGSSNIKLLNNTIFDMPGGGLRVSQSNHTDIIENEIYNCSSKSYSGTHALVVTKSTPISGTGYSIEILRNKIHDNHNEMFSWTPAKTKITPRIDEGKGISLQKNNTTEWVDGTGRILAANNLTYWNGFSGVHSNDGHRIDFINNTSYMNSYTNTVTYAGQHQEGNNIGISASNGDDVKMINNIVVIDTDWDAFPFSVTNDIGNLVIKNNLIYGFGGKDLTEDPHTAGIIKNTTEGDPLFVNVANFNFSLKSNSPARGKADKNTALSTDYYKNTRDSEPDLGAIEYISTTNYSLSVSASNGSVTPNNGSYAENTAATLTATPNAGYEFSNWSGDASGNSNPLTITMDADKNITAVFTQVPTNYTLSVTANNGSVTPNSGSYAENTVATLTATPDAGYEFSNWSGDASGNSNPLTITMDADKNITAVFNKISTTTNTVLDVIHDAHVRSGSYKNTNYGTEPSMQIKQASSSNAKRFAYLKFNLNGITNITSAVLRVTNTGSNGSALVKEVSQDNWNEGNITWNTKPSLGNTIGTYNFDKNGTFDIDVTDFVAAEANGNGKVTFVLKGTSSTLLNLASKESGNGAELIVTGNTVAAKTTNQKSLAVNTFNSDFDKITVYPNPTNSLVNIKIPNLDTKDGKVQVFDVAGRLIQTQQISSTSTQINLEGPTGIYILKIQNNDTVTIKKIVKK